MQTPRELNPPWLVILQENQEREKPQAEFYPGLKLQESWEESAHLDEPISLGEAGVLHEVQHLQSELVPQPGDTEHPREPRPCHIPGRAEPSAPCGD